MSESQNTVFGVNVWWTVPELVVDGQKVLDVLDEHGFQKGIVKLPSRRTEVSRAVYSFQNRQGKHNRRVVEKVKDNADELLYGILDRRKVNEEKVGFRQTTTVHLDKSNDSVTVEGRLSEEVLQAVHDYTGKVTDDDVRGFLRSVIRMCYGIAKRPSGGIYFVPARFAVMVEMAQQVLNDIGGGATLYFERVMDGEQERQNVWGSVEESIEQQVSEALMSVDRIEKSANAVKNHAMKLEGLDEMMDVYKDLLGEEAKHEAIAERIEEAAQLVQEKMANLQQGSAAALNKGGSKPVKSKLMEAAVEVLKASGEAMEFTEIADAAIAKGLYKGNCENPASSISTAISKAINRGDDRVVRVRRGVYALA